MLHTCLKYQEITFKILENKKALNRNKVKEKLQVL